MTTKLFISRSILGRAAIGGKYRARTCDLLVNSQSLLPTELIPHVGGSKSNGWCRHQPLINSPPSFVLCLPPNAFNGRAVRPTGIHSTVTHRRCKSKGHLVPVGDLLYDGILSCVVSHNTIIACLFGFLTQSFTRQESP